MKRVGAGSLGRAVGLGLVGGTAALTLSGDVAPKPPMDPMEAGVAVAAPYAACVVTSVVDLQRRTEARTDTSGSRTTVRVGIALRIGPQALLAYHQYDTDNRVVWDPAQLNGLVDGVTPAGKIVHVRVAADEMAGLFRPRSATTVEQFVPKDSYPPGTHMSFFVDNPVRVIEEDGDMTRVTGVTPCEGGAVMGADAAGQPEWQLDPAVQVPPDVDLRRYIP